MRSNNALKNPRKTRAVTPLLLLALLVLALGLLTLRATGAQARAPKQRLPKARAAAPAVQPQAEAEFTAVEHATVLARRDGQLDCRAATAAEARAMARPHNQPLYELRDETAALSETQQTQTGLKIVLRGTAQLNQHPEAKAAFLRAARAWESMIQNRITVVIDVDFGPTFFGEPYDDYGGRTYAQDLTRPNAYPQVREELIKGAGSPAEAAFYRALPPAHVPTNQGPATEMQYSSALLRALGRIPPVADPAHEPAEWGPPPRIGFNSAHNFDFDPSDGIKVKRDDFTATAMHEIGHALGFDSNVGRKEIRLDLPPRLEVLDLFRFRPGSVTSETFGTALRVQSSGGEQVFFGGGAELPLSTGRTDASGGDGRQAGHWKDLLFTRQYLGVMDPLSYRGYRYELTANDREAFEWMGYRTNPVPNPREAELKLDDGTMELGAAIDDLIIVNRLTPSSYPATLRKLRLMVPLIDQEPNATGQPLTLLIAATSNTNGPPPPIAQFRRIATTVPSASHELLLEFPVTNGPTINSGDFWVGYQAPSPHGGAGFAADTSNPARRSFFSVDDGASFEPLEFDDGLPANAIIRALVTLGDPAPTPTPTPQPTPAPTPEALNVALTSGVPLDRYIEGWNQYAGTISQTQYTIQVPSGATQLKFELEAQAADMDFYVRYGSRVALENSYVVYDYKVESDEYRESLTLTPASRPPLRAGAYYLMVINYGPGPTAFKIKATVTAPTGWLANVSAATFKGGELASGMLVSVFGERLATGTATGNAVPALLGTTVKVTDSRGVERAAPLFFVSPTQVNYVLPYETALGAATVTVTSGNGTVSTGAVQIAAVAPGVFTANSDGQGAPAAVALRVKANGAQSYEPVAQYDTALERFVPRALDLGAANEQVFLILYGTGWRNRPQVAGLTLRIGGTAVPVQFAGAAPGNPGVDQLNAALPRTLIGRGEVDVALTVDGKTANTVKVNIK